MANHMEDEEKIDENNQELMKVEHEEAHDKEASNNELVKVYLEDKKIEEKEKKEELENAKNHTVTTETKKYER